MATKKGIGDKLDASAKARESADALQRPPCAICKNAPVTFCIQVQVLDFESTEPKSTACERLWICERCMAMPVELVVVTFPREYQLLSSSHYKSDVLLASNPTFKNALQGLDAMHQALEQQGFKRGK